MWNLNAWPVPARATPQFQWATACRHFDGLDQNLRIGTKLAITAVLSILMLGGMIFVQLSGNAAVRQANETAIRQQVISQGALGAKAAVRGMQIPVRDIRLSNSTADLTAAGDYLAARQKSANEFCDSVLAISKVKETQDRMARIKALIGDYAAGAKQIAALRAEMIAVEAKRGAGRGDGVVSIHRA